MFTNTNPNTVRGVTVHDVQQGEQFHDGAPGRRLSELTHGIAHQPFIEPAGTIARASGWVEGSIR